MKRNLEFEKKITTVITQKRNYLVPYSIENPLAPMHLWHLSTISFWEGHFAEHLLKGVSYNMFFLFIRL